jgi:hypothetical protein
MAMFRALAKPIPAVKVDHKKLLFMITEKFAEDIITSAK